VVKESAPFEEPEAEQHEQQNTAKSLFESTDSAVAFFDNY